MESLLWLRRRCQHSSAIGSLFVTSAVICPTGKIGQFRARSRRVNGISRHKIAARKIEFYEPLQADLACPVPRAKRIRFSFRVIRVFLSFVLTLQEGRTRRHGRWVWDAMDAERAGRAALFRLRQSCDEPVPGSSGSCGERRSRTAKSCGPGAPRLALRLPGSMSPTTDGDNKVWSPGRARISRKTIRAGKAGMHRPNLWFLPRAFFPHGGHGCWPSTRSSLRPLISRGDAGCKTRVPSAARMRSRGPARAINHSRGAGKSR
jgi:hypothetical protein